MAESPAAVKRRALRILDILEQTYPGATVELRWRTPLELLAATILSAQCTDERVNQVTGALFRKYRTARDWARAKPAELEREIFSTGFYKAKTRALLGMAEGLIAQHGGEVPRTMEALTALPGVGRKTASVVLGNAFGVPAIAVDTHVFRVSQRLGLAKADDADEIHDQLCVVIPSARWVQATHLLIWHGRRTCAARAPSCPTCTVAALCPWPDKTGLAPARPAPGSGARATGPATRGPKRGKG
jgi:endonuclease-3